jgi:hypothetical protein
LRPCKPSSPLTATVASHCKLLEHCATKKASTHKGLAFFVAVQQ